MKVVLLALAVVLGGYAQSSLAANVPSVVGLPADKAIEAIKRAQLEPKQLPTGKISLQPISSVADQRPAGGTNVPAKSVVEFSLSSGVWVKAFIGESAETMASEMSQTGLKYEVFDEQAPFVGKGLVSSQTPAGGGFVDASTTTVGFGVAVGPWITVPDLAGQSHGAAATALQNLSLAPTVIAGPTGSGMLPPGGSGKGKGMCLQTPWQAVVVTFEPPAGSLLFPGEQVRLWTQKVMDHGNAISEPCYCEGNGMNCVLL